MRSFLLAAVLILSGCHHASPFNWGNACSDRLPCHGEDQFCDVGTGPDGEPYEYGQCVDFED